MDSNAELRIVRYLCGELPEAERAAFAADLDSDASLKALYTQMACLWQAGEQLRPALMLEASCTDRWARIKEQCFCENKSLWKSHAVLRWAAVWISLFVSVTALYLILQRDFVGWDSFYTENNMETIVLDDSTTITTLPNSMVKYRYTENQRLAKVEGMAFFKVAPNKARPFYVRFSKANLKVVGTSFWVEQIDGRNELAIEVAEGKVEFTANNETVSLVAGERLLFANDVVLKQPALVPTVQDWNDKNLTFHQASLGVVLSGVKAFYPELKLVQNNSKSDTIKVSTHFEKQPLSVVLEELSLHFHKNFSFADGVLQITD